MTEDQPITTSQYVPIILVLLAMGYLLFAIFRWWVADTHFAKGKGLTDSGYVSRALPELEQAVKLMPREPLFHDGLSDDIAKIAYGLYQQNATDTARQAAQAAVAESDQTLRLNHVHLNFWKTRIRLFLILANIDPNYAPKALDAFHQALALSPTDAKLYYNLGLLQIQLNQLNAGKVSLQKALELKPNYTEAKQTLGKL